MKVHIGPYRGDLIPINSLVRSYERMRSDKLYLDEDEYTWYDKIILGLLDKLDDLVLPINRWSNNRKRNIKVHIDNYDVWGADHTLAMIIAPTLKQLKIQQHGYPHVDNDDVPEELRFELTQEQKENWDGSVDAKHEARWTWVLDEMIWTFEQYSMSDDTDQFHHNTDQLEMVSTPLEDNPKLCTMSFNYQKDPSKPAYWVDEEGKKKHHERKQNGLRLFAKYYDCLWD